MAQTELTFQFNMDIYIWLHNMDIQEHTWGCDVDDNVVMSTRFLWIAEVPGEPPVQSLK